MNQPLTSALDAVLRQTVEGNPNVPGVVAMVTDSKANIF